MNMPPTRIGGRSAFCAQFFCGAIGARASNYKFWQHLPPPGPRISISGPQRCRPGGLNLARAGFDSTLARSCCWAAPPRCSASLRSSSVFRFAPLRCSSSVCCCVDLRKKSWLIYDPPARNEICPRAWCDSLLQMRRRRPLTRFRPQDTRERRLQLKINKRDQTKTKPNFPGWLCWDF